MLESYKTIKLNDRALCTDFWERVVSESCSKLMRPQIIGDSNIAQKWLGSMMYCL